MDRILIIEDDADIALPLKYYLERVGGFAVTVEQDGEAGLANATRHSPDLIVLDLNLPGLDGIGSASAARGTATMTIQIIMLTRAGRRKAAGRLERGPREINQALLPKEVVARIRAACGGARTPSPPRPPRRPALEVDESGRQVSGRRPRGALTRRSSTCRRRCTGRARLARERRSRRLGLRPPGRPAR